MRTSTEGKQKKKRRTTMGEISRFLPLVLRPNTPTSSFIKT